MRWGLIKKGFTQRTKGLVGIAHPTISRERHRESTVWQRRFWEHQIRDERDFSAHFNYIHYNPVKHGLVKSPRDWLYSTFHRYVKTGVYSMEWGMNEIDFPGGIGSE
jgi:putative transposase